MSPRPALPVSRRQFLLGTGVATGAVLLGGCGGDDSSGEPPTTSTSGGLNLVQFFGGLPMLVAGTEVRAPFGVADADGVLPPERGPDLLQVSILGPDGEIAVDPIEVARHGKGLTRGYFPLRFRVDEPGIYTGRTEVDGEALEMSIKVDAAEDVTTIQPGTRLPALDTPTPADGQGVEPICTRDPACPLHDVTVAEALDDGKPLALLVSTPAFCQIDICGPVLEVLLTGMDDHPGVRYLHAEVYAHPEEDLDAKAPVVDELGLTFEPCLVLVGSDGMVVDRLDIIFDEVELGAALAGLR